MLLAEVTSPRPAGRVAARVRAEDPAARYIGIVSADLGDDVEHTVHELKPVLAEIICFDALAVPPTPGQDLAMRALEEFGFGQDFVFTVPRLDDAIDYALTVLGTADRHGWEGAGLLIPGPAQVIDRARRHLLRSR